MNSLLPLLLVLSTLNCLNKAPEDTKLYSLKGSFHGMNLNSITAYFGVSSKHSKMETNFELQLNLPYILIGNQKEVEWGIGCESSKEGKEDPGSTCEYNPVRILNF